MATLTEADGQYFIRLTPPRTAAASAPETAVKAYLTRHRVEKFHPLGEVRCPSDLTVVE